MGYKDSVKKDNSKIWTSPIMDWSKKDCEGWIKAHNLPRNPVKDKICISGECLCGCFAKPEEYAEIKASYPDAWEKLEKMKKYSKWGWGKDPNQWRKHNPEGQMKIPFMPMCVGCESKEYPPPSSG
jgi:3'-phosphoadenosine 5'-phosphosulfate sulfotransferase (PAPS reductase)/FAD synthetase